MEIAESRGLEYLVIPVGIERWEKPRIESAKTKIETNHIDNVVITGDIDREKRLLVDFLKHSGEGGTYSAMRKYFLPGQMRIFRGIDSEEDILYLGRFVKPRDTVYFDTFPLHYLEYRTLINKAQRDGKFPKGVKIKNVPIRQGAWDTVYGFLGLMEEVLKRRPIDYKRNRQNDSLDKVKHVVKKLLGAY